MKKYDAVIAGYTCMDMFPCFRENDSPRNLFDLLKPGKLIEIGEMNIVPGGVVPNTGLLMKHFGNNVFLNGLTGTDLVGQIAGECFNRRGASDGIMKTDEAFTAYSIVIAPPGVDRIFLESPGCNRIFNIGHINFDAVKNARLFHFGYPPLLRRFYLDEGRQLTEMYRKVHELGVVTSLDFSLPDPESESGKVDWAGIMQRTLPYVDIFVPSIEELFCTMMPREYSEILANCKNSDFEDEVPFELVRELGAKVVELGACILLIKMGKHGIYLRTGDVSSANVKLGKTLSSRDWNNREILCKAYHSDGSKIKNASGAGDTAIAAFLTSVLNAGKPEVAVKYAAVAGRDSLYCDSIFDDMSTWEKLTTEINAEPNELIKLFTDETDMTKPTAFDTQADD
jgi:sugar/nucleoside kinase (ribokinase family)